MKKVAVEPKPAANLYRLAANRKSLARKSKDRNVRAVVRLLTSCSQVGAIHPIGSCKTMAQEFGALICVVTAKRSLTWAAKAHMKLTFERIERNPRRRRFASASM